MTAPFVDVPDRRVFFVGGVAYSAFLAFVAIGISLLREPLRHRLLWIGLAIALVCVPAALAYPLLALRSGFEFHAAPVLSFLVTLLLVAVVFAIRGWYQHLTHASEHQGV